MRRFFLFFFWIDNDSSYMEVKVNVYRRGIHVNGGIERIVSFCGCCMATGVDNLDRCKLKKKRKRKKKKVYWVGSYVASSTQNDIDPSKLNINVVLKT